MVFYFPIFLGLGLSALTEAMQIQDLFDGMKRIEQKVDAVVRFLPKIEQLMALAKDQVEKKIKKAVAEDIAAGNVRDWRSGNSFGKLN